MTTTYISEQEKAVVQCVHDTANGIQQIGGVQSITRSSTTATVIRPAHGYINGTTITIAGADQSAYNGSFTITYVDADTFTYTVSGSPATPATGTITSSAAGQSVWMHNPQVLYVSSIAAATTVKVEAAIRTSLGWVQVGADLTSSDNGTLVTLSKNYNFVRLRRSSGSGSVKVYAQF